MFQIHPSIRGSEVLIAGIMFGAISTAVRAAECGKDSPDYSANRVVSIGGTNVASRVFVSGFKLRDEQRNAGRTTVMLRLPEQAVSYVFDPDRKTGVKLPAPPAQPRREVRLVQDKPEGSNTELHEQLQSKGRWVELSTTTCNADDVMVRKSFQSIDPKGHIVTVQMTQSNITVEPLPSTLFEVPQDVSIR